MLTVVTLDTPQLGNRSYLAHDGEEGLVVDPPRDIDRVESAAERAGVRITGVAETHIHNDYVSGGRRLATRHAADYYVAAGEPVEFDRVRVADGDSFGVGSLRVEVIATPGHTREHQALLMQGDEREAPALFSGGSLLYGTVGRTDLAGPELTEPLSRAQHRSARRLGSRLHPTTQVFPTHGFGSFCASGQVATTCSTIGEELLRNPALRTSDEEEFVRALVAGLGPVPSYYAHMDGLNRVQELRGMRRRTPRLGRGEVVAAQRQGAHVVDLRERTPYAARHLEGTTHVPYGTQCATYVGWLVPWGEPIVLLAEDEGTIQEALTDLARIGIERVEGTTVLCGGSVPECGPGYRRVRWEDLAGALREVRRLVVLDVRQRAEYDAGHLAGAISIPLQELRDQLPRLPVGDLWVHCQSGYRAAAAASLVHAAGRDVVLVDDDLGRAAEAGLSMAGLPGS